MGDVSPTDEANEGGAASNPYTAPTGEGYLGTTSVLKTSRIRLADAEQSASGIEVGDQVAILPHPYGAAAVSDEHLTPPEAAQEAVTTHPVFSEGSVPAFTLAARAYRVVTADDPDELEQVRVYDLREYTAPARKGLLIVDADADPTLGGDDE